MGITDLIACFINEMLDSEDGCAELQRAEIANRFRCVPSQINYVISTRFSPEHGYIVESRRGGNGYIRIRRVEMNPRQCVMHVVNAVGDEIDAQTARAFLSNLLGARALDRHSADLMAAAVSDRALQHAPPPHRDAIRAGILKQMLTSMVCKGVRSDESDE